MPRPALTIGLGSDHGDDRAGWLVIASLQRRGWSSDEARIARHPSELLDWCDPERSLVVCDACEGSGEPGTIRRWTWPRDRWPSAPFRNTHDFPLCAVLEVARATARMATEVFVWTIEGRFWSPTATPSSGVAHAAKALAASIDEEYPDA